MRGFPGSVFSVVPLSALGSTGASPAPRFGNFHTAGSLASDLSRGPQNPVTAWGSVSATDGDLQVASVHLTLSVGKTVPGFGRLGILPARLCRIVELKF